MRGEVLGVERRRRWSDEDKLSILSSIGIDGATVTQVAYRCDVTCKTWSNNGPQKRLRIAVVAE
jgi:transposase-like protein